MSGRHEEPEYPTWRRLLPRPVRRVLALIPELPDYDFGGSGPVVPQAVILRDVPFAEGTSSPVAAGVAGRASRQEVLLLLRTSPRAWELPGGGIEGHESSAEGVVREVEEETGLRVEVVRLVGRYRRTGFRPHRSPVYACRVSGGALRSNFESVTLGWFPVDRLPPGLFPWYVPVIRDAANGVTHAEEQVQHLGVGMVLRSIGIHLSGILRPRQRRAGLG